MNEIRDKHGAESMVFIQGTGRNVGGWLLLLSYSYGSPNWLQGGLTGNSCFHPRLVSMRITQGDYTVPDCSQFFQDRYDTPGIRPAQVHPDLGPEPRGHLQRRIHGPLDHRLHETGDQGDRRRPGLHLGRLQSRHLAAAPPGNRRCPGPGA